MNRSTKYSKILSKFLTEFAAKYNDAPDGLTTIAILDTKGQHYQLAVHGFQKEPKKHVFDVQFHFDIIDDKIWIQKNNTDIPVEHDLILLGVPKSDIVFGCVPETVRYYYGFGVDEKAA